MYSFSGKHLILGILVLFVLFATAYATPILSSVGIEKVYPEGNLSVNQGFIFHVTTNVSCSGGDCGDINVSLDPYPPECSSYTPVNWDINIITNGAGTSCTSGLAPGWYRLTGTYSKIAAQRPYVDLVCNTYAPGFINFAYPSSPGQTTSGDICYHYSGSTCLWSSTGVKITACAGYYVYYLTPAPGCYMQPCATNVIPDPPQDKLGLVNETYGAIPFSTNGTNPRTITLDNGQSQLVTFWVNATGGVWNYSFFAYANETANMAINDQTDNWTVSVYPPPSVSFVDLPSFIKTTDPAANVTINISTDYFFGTPESATLDSVWWGYGSGNNAYTSPTTHAFAPGSYVLTAYANDTEGNVYSSNGTLDIGNVACGDMITSDTVMTANLDCSAYSGNAVQITADNVVFDCDGHTITGPGNNDGITSIERNNVTIKNCDITRFHYGIYADYSDDGKILNNTLSNSQYGLYMEYSDFNSVLTNTFTNNSYGFYLYRADSNQIGRNNVIDTIDLNFGSCPFLYLWNGSGYSYYTDLGGEPLGASWFKPQEYQAGVYELGDFKAEDGVYKLKVREVIPESDYFDQAKLALVDVPEGYSVLSKWSNTYAFNQAPDTGFMTIKDPIPPISATDGYGNDVLSEVSDNDGVPVTIYNMTQNPVIVDFGAIDDPANAKLIITGWGPYESNPSSGRNNYLVVETMGPDGNWVVRKNFGSFIGDSRTIVFDISNILTKDDTRMRITGRYSPSTINVIDQILLDDSAPVDFKVTYVDPSVADLRWGGSTPFVYATAAHRHMDIQDEQNPDVQNFLMYGNFTRYGDVKGLLGEADDMSVVMRHGDEMLLQFVDPPKADGVDRHVFMVADVMYTIKYGIDGFVNDSIDPMPFHGMSKYPYGADEHYPTDEEHQAYRAEWNTRSYGQEPKIGGSLPYSFNNTVFDNTIIGAQYSTGLYLDDEDSTSLIDNHISAVETGIDIYQSTNTTVRGNHISTAYGRGIFLEYNTDDSRILENVILSNNSGGCYSGYCGGVSIYSGSNDNTVQGNTITAINSYGIYITNGASGNIFLHNTIKSDAWVSDNVGGNTFNDSDTGNTYYFANGVGAWEEYNISDKDGNGYADAGSDLPFGNAVLDGIWPDTGVDYHPGIPIIPSSSHNQHATPQLAIEVSSDCNGSIVSVTSKGDPVSGATVAVFDSSSLVDVASGSTDEMGRLAFSGCGETVRAHASKDGYLPADADVDLVSCGSCAVQPECTDNAGCSADKVCSDQKCAPITCACGSISNHECVEYACCSDADCGTGNKCSDHKCVSSEQPKPPEQPKPECTVDSDCGSGKICTSSKCVLKPECAKDSDCQNGYGCVGSKCVKTETPPPVAGNKTSTTGGTPAAPPQNGQTGPGSVSGPEPVLMVGLLILLVAVMLVVVYFLRPKKK